MKSVRNQQTVNCPTCKGRCGQYVESERQALDRNGDSITVYSRTWQPCTGPCGGSGQVVGGRG